MHSMKAQSYNQRIAQSRNFPVSTRFFPSLKIALKTQIFMGNKMKLLVGCLHKV